MFEIVQQASFLMLFLWLFVSSANKHGSAWLLIMNWNTTKIWNWQQFSMPSHLFDFSKNLKLIQQVTGTPVQLHCKPIMHQANLTMSVTKLNTDTTTYTSTKVQVGEPSHLGLKIVASNNVPHSAQRRNENWWRWMAASHNKTNLQLSPPCSN